MRKYQLSSTFFSLMRFRILTSGLPLMILAAVAGVWIGNYRNLSWTAIFISVIVFLFISIISLQIILREVQRFWLSYQLILDEHSIKRKQDKLPDIAINYQEISEITEIHGSSLDIRTPNPSQWISVPVTLEDYSEFRIQIEKIHPIETIPESRLKWLPVQLILWVLAALAMFVITILSTNRSIVMVIGTLLIVTQLVSLVQVQRSINFTKLAKPNSRLVLIASIIIIATVIFAILGK